MPVLTILCRPVMMVPSSPSRKQAEGSTSQEGFETFEQLTPRVQTNDYIIP